MSGKGFLTSIRGGALAGLALCAAAMPASAFEIFHGGGFVGGFTGCESQGWNGSQPVTARFQHAGLPGNDPDNHTLVLNLGTGTHVYRFPDSPDLGSGVNAEFWQIWSHAPNQVFDPQVTLRVVMWASDVLQDENDLDMTAHMIIDNFNGVAGCSARVGLYLRRPAPAAG